MWGGIAGIQIPRDEETLIAITGYAGAADVNMTWLPAYLALGGWQVGQKTGTCRGTNCIHIQNRVALSLSSQLTRFSSSCVANAGWPH